MALNECHECGKEISSEAKTCPNCGARNRAYKSDTKKYWFIGTFIVVFGIISYIYVSHDSYVYNLTSCDTSRHRESFVSVIDGSAYSQKNKLRVIDVTKIKTIKSGESITDLVCDATVHYNSMRKEKYRFTWRESDSGNIIITASPRKK